MEEFFIDVRLDRGITRVQVQEVTPEVQAMLQILYFTIDFYRDNGFITLTLRLQNGKWYDRNSRFNDDEYYLHDLCHDDWDPDYQSPLSQGEINRTGAAIANYMVVKLVAQMSLFIPVFTDPTLN